jgi:hypothetical protein
MQDLSHAALRGRQRQIVTLYKEEARHVTDMARRIAALLVMGPALDANYEAVKRDAKTPKSQK